MTATYQFKEVHDATYAYTIQGEGEVIVALHGFTGSTETWETCVKHWAKNFTVITLDLPGHGKTNTETPRTMEILCDDLNSLLRELGFHKVHMLGYSMGGRAALSFAVTYPERVHTLILESASPGLKTEEERAKRMEADERLAGKLITQGIQHFTNYWEEIPLFQTQKQLSEKVQKNIRQERLSQSETGLAESLRYMGTGKQPSVWERLNELLMPVQLIVGEKDRKFVEINQEMKEQIKNAQLDIVEGAGHTVHVEQVEKLDRKSVV